MIVFFRIRELFQDVGGPIKFFLKFLFWTCDVVYSSKNDLSEENKSEGQWVEHMLMCPCTAFVFEVENADLKGKFAQLILF